MSKKGALIGTRLGEEILKYYKSKREFALAIGIRPQALNNYLNGNIIPGRSMLEKFKKAGLDINYILYGEEGAEHDFACGRSEEQESEIEKLRGEIERLKDEIEKLKHKLAKREGQIELLKGMLREAERGKKG